jgi:hypothetical protein
MKKIKGAPAFKVEPKMILTDAGVLAEIRAAKTKQHRQN